jgi:hypothetical protein
MICLRDPRWQTLHRRHAELRARLLIKKSQITAEAARLGLTYAEAVRLAKEAA